MSKKKANHKVVCANLDTNPSKGQSRIPQSNHFNARGPTPEDEIPTPQDFNAGGFNAAGIPKRAKVATVLHFFNAGGDFNAGGEFQRQRISTPNSGIEDPLGWVQSARRGVEREGSRHVARVYRARDGMRDDVGVVADGQARAR